MELQKEYFEKAVKILKGQKLEIHRRFFENKKELKLKINQMDYCIRLLEASERELKKRKDSFV